MCSHRLIPRRIGGTCLGTRLAPGGRGVILLLQCPMASLSHSVTPQQDSSDDPPDYASPVFLPPISFHEAHFINLPGQSNVYGLLELSLGGANRLLVATVACVRGELFCLEFKKGSLRPTLAPITFTYIPGDAEVVSIDSFVRKPNGVIIGVTLVKTDSDPKEMYFNLYGSQCDPEAPFQCEKIAEDWQGLRLDFTPFQLTHTCILVEGRREMVFLLSGDDLKVHMYQEVCHSAKLQFQERPSEPWFPELQSLPSSITYMAVKVAGGQRLTALGCQNGFLKCALVDLSSGSILKAWDTRAVDGPITSIKLFTVVSEAANAEPPAGETGLNDLHMLVTSAVELGVVFQCVAKEGFCKPCVLPSSHLHDSVLCSQVADVNWDGENELILGTYGKAILIYQHNKVEGMDQDLKFELVWKRSFSHPLHCLWYGDLTHDGLCELVAVSMAGVHILQHNLQDAVAVCVNRLMLSTRAEPTDAAGYSIEAVHAEHESGYVT